MLFGLRNFIPGFLRTVGQSLSLSHDRKKTSAFRLSALISFKFDHFNGNPFNKKGYTKI